MQDYLAAVTDFDNAIELAPDNAANYVWRGRAYMAAEEYPTALADFTAAIERQPDSAYNYAWRGRAYFKLNNLAKAEDDIAQVEELLAERGDPAYLVASSYAERSQVTKACTWLRWAIQRNESFVDQVRIDSAFDPIREAVDFGRLMVEFEPPQPGTNGLRAFARRLFKAVPDR